MVALGSLNLTRTVFQLYDIGKKYLLQNRTSHRTDNLTPVTLFLGRFLSVSIIELLSSALHTCLQT